MTYDYDLHDERHDTATTVTLYLDKLDRTLDRTYVGERYNGSKRSGFKLADCDRIDVTLRQDATLVQVAGTLAEWRSLVAHITAELDSIAESRFCLNEEHQERLRVGEWSEHEPQPHDCDDPEVARRLELGR